MSRQTQVVANLLFLGTEQHRDSVDEQGNPLNTIITEYAASLEDNGQDQFVHLIDGVGGVPAKDSSGEHPILGTYVYQPSDTEPGKGKKLPNTKYPEEVVRVLGKFLGKGVEDSVIEAAQYISQLDALDKKPDVVNLSGFSRGGYTAILVARMLNHFYPDIDVNLFLIDPVPGPSTHDVSKAYEVPPNVKDLKVVLQMDELRKEFEPLDQSTLHIASPSTTRVEYLTVPGGHSAAIKYKSDETKGLPRLVTGILYDFYQQHDAKIRDDHPPAYYGDPLFASDRYKHILRREDRSPENQLAEFHLLHRFKEDYQEAAEKRNRAVPIDPRKSKAHVYTRQRRFMRNRDDYVRDGDFFICARHRQLFANQLPKLFDYLFKQNQGGHDFQALAREIKDYHDKAKDTLEVMRPLLRSKDVHLGELLEAFDKNTFDESQFFKNHPVFPAQPGGDAYPEELNTVGDKPIAHDPLSALVYHSNDAINRFLAQRPLGKNKLSARHAIALKYKIDEVLSSNLSNTKKRAAIRNAIKHDIKSLTAQKGNANYIQALENCLDDANSFANRVMHRLTKHLSDEKKQFSTETKRDMVYAINHINDIKRSDLSELDKMTGIAKQLDGLMKKLLSTDVKKAFQPAVIALALDLENIKMHKQSKSDRRIDMTIRQLEAYIERKHLRAPKQDGKKGQAESDVIFSALKAFQQLKLRGGRERDAVNILIKHMKELTQSAKQSSTPTRSSSAMRVLDDCMSAYPDQAKLGKQRSSK